MVDASEAGTGTNGRTPGRARSRSGARRRAIALKAAELFDSVGYNRTSMDDIASAAGLRKPSLYYYFSTKDEILVSIHDEFVGALLARSEARRGIPMSPDQRLLEMAVDILELARTHGAYARVYFSNIRELPEGAVEHVLVKRDEYQLLIRQEFDRGIAEGGFRDIDAFLASRAFFGMCVWSYFWHADDWTRGPREIAYVLWDMLLAGIQEPRKAGYPEQAPGSGRRRSEDRH